MGGMAKDLMPVKETAVLDAKTFRRFCDLIYEIAGIKLGEKKEALVSGRVRKRMRALEINCYKEYLDLVANDKEGKEIVELLNAISTNVTHFYREERHFELLAGFLSQWRNEGQDEFRIWCAAASTGEEPYSIAITANEALGSGCSVRLLATDLSTKVLMSAKKGEYEMRKMEKVSSHRVSRWFHKMNRNGETCYQVDESLKRMITFARLNLATPPFPMRGPFDIIFCRNVMIYFDNEVRKRLLDESYRLLKPGGYLLVGHAESLSGLLSNFKSVEPSVYVKVS